MFKFVFSFHQMTPLHCAALKCHFVTLQYLVGAGANVNVKDKNGVSVQQFYHISKCVQCILGYLGIHRLTIFKLWLLLSIMQWTPLYCAALEGHVDIVQVLIKKGADINAKNNGGVRQ